MDDEGPKLSAKAISPTQTRTVTDETEQGLKRNPPWSRDELVLALDLYLRFRSTPLAKDSQEVAELSEFLGRMGRAFGITEAEKFRNVNGVYMKIKTIH